MQVDMVSPNTSDQNSGDEINIGESVAFNDRRFKEAPLFPKNPLIVS